MKFNYLITLSILSILPVISCKTQPNLDIKVLIKTDYGNIKLKLYNETPIHRDNFIKLIKNGFYTDRIFHRVIKDFMIQGGDPNLPKPSTDNSFTYTIPAEINPKFYHKRGVLAAARKADAVNQNRESNGTQFYIVQGEIYTPEKLNQIETNINQEQFQLTARKYYTTEIQRLKSKDSTINNQQIKKKIIAKVYQEIGQHPFKFTPEQIKIYTTIGGVPNLDGSYTIFGEVMEGMEVVDKIANLKTLSGDRPEKDVKFTIEILR
ncbi:MAG: peptidylprolyl isomerase [Bacteroidota bacterium]|nr:peptidylprolyl isomerase [Bacteroidota bacterium]